ncbi:hypothetical protein KM043_007404 [Ampulex compressa]|nr:hypothetical protein KM043_007404 [Ampulex compressa]
MVKVFREEDLSLARLEKTFETTQDQKTALSVFPDREGKSRGFSSGYANGTRPRLLLPVSVRDIKTLETFDLALGRLETTLSTFQATKASRCLRGGPWKTRDDGWRMMNEKRRLETEAARGLPVGKDGGEP